MNRVAFDFRERVAALWKCCDLGYFSHLARCENACVPDCEWTMKSKKQLIVFVIGEENGEWSYRFSNPDRTRGAKESLSMDELKKNPNLKHVRIQWIEVSKANRISMHPLRSRADIELLMKFVFFLSNEPQLELDISNVQIFESPEGATLLKCLSKMTFSRISMSTCFPVYNQILENQFSRRKPTSFYIEQSSEFRFLHKNDFFVKNLGNGNIKRFTGSSSFRLPAELMERIISSFLENSANYDKNQLYITACFEALTKGMLERKLKEGRCAKVVDCTEDSTEYRFTANNPELKNNPCMRITFSHFGSSIWVD